MLGICLNEKEELLEPVAELRNWEGHHGCAQLHWNIPKGNQWMLFLEYSYKLYSFLPYKNIAMYHLPPAWTVMALFSQQAITAAIVPYSSFPWREAEMAVTEK